MNRPLSEVLQALDANEGIELPMDPEYYERLHNRIMAAVELNEKAPPDWYEKPKGSHKHRVWIPEGPLMAFARNSK